MTPVLVVNAVIAVAMVAAFILAGKWRARTAAVSLVVLMALLTVPRLFAVDGLFLRKAANLDASRIAMIAGLDVGALGVVLLAFLVVGFVVPLIGAVLRARQTRDRKPLIAHAVLIGCAIAVSAFPATPVYRDAHFAMFRGTREGIVRAVAAGEAELVQDKSRRGLQRLTAPAFPRVACCGNVVYVLDGRAVLFPMQRFGAGSWGYLHDGGAWADSGLFHTEANYGNGWRRVAIDWTQADAMLSISGPDPTGW